MAAVRYGLVIEQGATFEFPITWYADERRSRPINLTDYSARMQIRPSVESTVILYDSADNSPHLWAWHQMNLEASPSTAGIPSNIFLDLENWLKYGWSTDNSTGGWSVDRLLELGVTNQIMGWVWGMVDAGYVTGPYDPAWDPGPDGGPAPGHPTQSGCSPITEEQHRLMVGSSFINQVRASLGLNTVRRQKITELHFYQGSCPVSETATLTSGYDKYLASAIACGAAVIFDAEGSILYEGYDPGGGTPGVDPAPSGQEGDIIDPIVNPGDSGLVITPHRVLRQRMRELGIVAGCEPGPQKTASCEGWFRGETIAQATFGYLANAVNRPNLYWWPGALRDRGVRYMELLWNFDPSFGQTQNIASQIAKTKQLIADGYHAVLQFGYGGAPWTPDHPGLMTQTQIRDLVEFDRQNSENGHISLGGTAGTVNVKIPPGITKALAAGNAVYDILLTSPSGEVTRLIEGPVDVRPAVTENA